MARQHHRLAALEARHAADAALPEPVRRQLAGTPQPGDDIATVLWALRQGLDESTAVDLVGMPLEQLQQQRAEDPPFDRACRQAIAKSKAMVATRLLDGVRAGDTQAIALWMRTREQAEAEQEPSRVAPDERYL